MNRTSGEEAAAIWADRKHVIPPAVLALRMQRYALYLMIGSFLLMAANFTALSAEAVLWFASGITAAFALLCAIAVIILNAIAWQFDRLKKELEGRASQAVDMR